MKKFGSEELFMKAYLIAIYMGALMFTGFVALGFQLIMWYYVAMFVGIPVNVWIGFAVFSFFAKVAVNLTQAEFKKYWATIKEVPSDAGDV